MIFRRVNNQGQLLLALLASMTVSAAVWSFGPATIQPSDLSRIDALGDPLPADAVARLGTTRFRHGANVRQIAWSSDGKSVFSAAQDAPGVRAWDVATGRESRRFGDTNVGGFAISRDGRRLVTSEDFGALRLWNTETGQEELPRLSPGASTPHERVQFEHETIKPVQFVANDSKVICLRTQSHSLEVWDVAARRLVIQIPSEADHPIATFHASADGKVILAGTQNGPAITFDGTNGKPIATFREQREQVYAVAICKDGTALSASNDKTVHGWKAASGKPQFRIELTEYPNSLVLSPDEKSFAFAFHDSESSAMGLELRSIADGKLIRRFADLPAPVDQITFSSDGSTLAAVANSTILTFAVATGKPIRPIIGHPSAITTLVFSPDGSRAATCSMRDRTAILWDVAKGRELRRFADHPAGVDEVQFSPDGKLLATGCWDHPVFLWDTSTGRLVHSLAEHPSVGPLFRFAADGKTIATAGRGNVVGIWDCSTGRRVIVHPAPGHGVASILLYADGKLLALAKPDPDDENEVATIDLWDVASERLVRRFAGHQGMVNSAVLSNDARTLASRGEDNVIRIWEVATGAKRREYSDPDESTGWTGTQFLAFSPDSRILASCGNSTTIAKLWDLAGDRELPPLRGHIGWLAAIEFSSDGKRLMTGSHDTTALIWDIQARVPRRLASIRGANELKNAWEQLSVTDGGKAYEALLMFVDAGDAGTEFLGQRLKSGVGASSEQIARWIGELDHPQFTTRERATAALIQVAGQGEAQLRLAAKSGSAEVRRRVQQIQQAQHDIGGSTDRIRKLRALEALEMIRTPAARQLFHELADGPAGAFVTREAQAAVRRLELRKTP